MSESPLAKRITDTQSRIVQMKDALHAHLQNVDDENPVDADLAMTEELNKKIETQEKLLKSYQDAETRLAVAVASDNDDEVEVAHKNGTAALATVKAFADGGRRPFAAPAKEIKPVDHIWRSLAASLKHHCEGKQRPILDVLADMYGVNQKSEMTRQVMKSMVTKAASAPADTTTTGWASDLVQTAFADFMEALMPVSIYPQLADKGGKFTFGQAGVVSIPYRETTPTIGGAFVTQGNPIPVKQGSFNQLTLTPKKMGVISTFTREIAEHSTPAIEGLVRQAILDDTAVAVDTVLVDGNAATTTRPAGLRNGVAALGPTNSGGATLASVIGDLKLLAAALIASSSGNVRSPVWIISPADVLALSLIPTTAGSGSFPFRDELSRGTLLGYPVIQSTTTTSDTFFLIDAADFVTATGDTPRFDVSDQAVLNYDDTTPDNIISSGGSASTKLTKSLWQTDSIGVRMLLDINWAMRRTGMVQYVSSIAWN